MPDYTSTEQRRSDRAVLDEIQSLLDGRDWRVDDLETIAELVRATGRQIGPPYVTKTGKVLTDEDIRAFADEAERGYVLCVACHAALKPEDSTPHNDNSCRQCGMLNTPENNPALAEPRHEG